MGADMIPSTVGTPDANPHPNPVYHHRGHVSSNSADASPSISASYIVRPHNALRGQCCDRIDTPIPPGLSNVLEPPNVSDLAEPTNSAEGNDAGTAFSDTLSEITASELEQDSPPLPQSPFPPRAQKSLYDRRHRKNAHSIDSLPRQTIMKALASRPPPSNLSIASSINELLASKEENEAQEEPITSKRLSAALAGLSLSSSSLSASKMAALASPCFFHKKFDKAVNIDRVLEEIQDSSCEGMSHSRLMQTATGVREVSRQLQRRPIKITVRNVMIVTKARDNHLVQLTRELAEWLLTTPRYGSDAGVNVYVDAKLRKSKRFDMEGLLAKDTRFEHMLRFWTPDLCWTSPEKFDLVLTLGGDGTVLYTSWLFQRIVPPILSFSLGSLGFLTNFEFQRYKEQLDKVMSSAGMRVNMRMRFTCTVYRSQPGPTPHSPRRHIEAEQFEVLNELVIDRGPSPYVSSLELYGDDHKLTTIAADGVIFSTPTGSTAYSLSAGGSLVAPDIPAILLTPICPHTLSFRPMILSDSMLLKVKVPERSRATAYCAFDGKARLELRHGDAVTISASSYPFPTVLAEPTEWFDSISRTLRWNSRSARQKGWGEGEGGEGGQAEGEEDIEEEESFDIDIDDDDYDNASAHEDASRDSGYSAGSSSAGGRGVRSGRGR
ncbi:NAD(+) kinase [Coniosporium tulheliwenetii]|uniref:NAD(+) kinase n=1 Tax=Coniosporium tulheliwenetii TaxID=3383036 RepID=A0ACC2YUH6_9PEZI|nr:NAD(+) kinase [Cladosporium sp. JES 115]